MTRGHGLETTPKALPLGKHGLSSHSEETTKGKVFGILS
jgi:hypothetical protein